METPERVQAAPNRSRITARVTTLRRDQAFPDRWFLEIEVQSSRSLEGTDWAARQRQAEAFVVAPDFSIAADQVIQADAEFIGGPTGGRFRLTNVRRVAE